MNKCACGGEIDPNAIYNIIINNKIENVCEDCWIKYLKSQNKGESK